MFINLEAHSFEDIRAWILFQYSVWFTALTDHSPYCRYGCTDVPSVHTLDKITKYTFHVFAFVSL